MIEIVKEVIEKDKQLRDIIYSTENMEEALRLQNKRLDLIYDSIPKVDSAELILFLTSLSISINTEIQTFMLEMKVKNQFRDVYRQLQSLKK